MTNLYKFSTFHYEGKYQCALAVLLSRTKWTLCWPMVLKYYQLLHNMKKCTFSTY